MREVTAVARAADILSLVASTESAPRAGSIAAALDIPRNTTYELVHTLADRGLLFLDPEGRIHLGQRVIELAGRYIASTDWLSEATAVARRLRDESGETVHVAVLDGRDVVYVVKEDSPRPLQIKSFVGRRLPAHVSGVGKALLAELESNELTQLLDGVELEGLTEHSITTTEDLVRELKETRERGYAIDREESSPEISCVAAPIVDVDANLIAGLSVSLPTTRLTADREKGLARLVRSAAAELGGRLGYQSEGVFAVR